MSKKALALLKKVVTLLRKIVSLLKITVFGENDALSAKKRQKKSRLAKPTDSKAKTVILRQQNKTA